ncbi:MAG: adenylosuccinate lyase [Phycisphaerae bacterium]|nr:adenylosuccinate lyase [Phycisphaerae bacterium]
MPAKHRRAKLDVATDVYHSPLVARYASCDMAAIFSPMRRALTWRRIWLALAEAQHEMGLPIKASQLRALRARLADVDLKAAAKHERRLRHDVMAHLHAFADQAPGAHRILHLGATSMDIVDNADLILMREALLVIQQWLVTVIDALAAQARKHRRLPCLGFTHYQPAQPTTLGKRIALWCWDFVRDLEETDVRIADLRFRGIRGATGTQASFLKLLGGNAAKVRQLETRVAAKLGFKSCEPVTGQTYSRKVDARIVAVLANIAAGVHKLANDIRLLANLKEVEEPFGKSQVGSSAMAYKRNPMLCERATGLSRFVIALAQSAFQNAAEQWLERTLDDSANKRLLIPEAFLATDAMLQIVAHVAGGLVVYPKVMKARLDAELPFMLTEDILTAAMAAGAGARAKAGGDRQELHERIRVHAQAAAAEVKRYGRRNDLLERIRNDAAFASVSIDGLLKPDVPEALVGMAVQQVDDFLRSVIAPLKRRHRNTPRRKPEISV